MDKHILRLILKILLPVSGWLLLCFFGPRCLKFFMPFVIGWLISMLANPLVRFLEMKAEMINSRKLGVQAVITVEIRAEGEENAYAASDVKMSGTEGGMIPEKDVPEVRTGIISPVVLALHRKDTYRIRETTAVTGGRPDIARLLWKEIHIGNQTVKPLEGRLYLEGQLNVFVIYETEEENMPVQWMEEVLPFSGDIEISQAHEGQIPQVSVRLSHGEIEVKPDAEGQMRELDVDVVLELDIRLYEEKEETLIRDMYSNSSKLIPDQ